MVEEKRTSRKGMGGPKTAAGKAVVRRNPIKHGALALRPPRQSGRSGQAPTPVIPLVEREEDWQRLRQGVFDFFELEGAAGVAWGPGGDADLAAVQGNAL